MGYKFDFSSFYVPLFGEYDSADIKQQDFS